MKLRIQFIDVVFTKHKGLSLFQFNAQLLVKFLFFSEVLLKKIKKMYQEGNML